jgi:hypothetical protein
MDQEGSRIWTVGLPVRQADFYLRRLPVLHNALLIYNKYVGTTMRSLIFKEAVIAICSEYIHIQIRERIRYELLQ